MPRRNPQEFQKYMKAFMHYERARTKMEEQLQRALFEQMEKKKTAVSLRQSEEEKCNEA